MKTLRGIRISGLVVTTLLLTMTLLGSCGSDGDDDDGVVVPPPFTEQYLFYYDIQEETQGTYTNIPLGGVYSFGLDPRDPAVTVVASNVNVEEIASYPLGTYDSGTMEISGFHEETIVYAQGGKIYKLGSSKDSPPVPVQVSTESEAGILCESEHLVDFADHGNSVYAYISAGPDNDCWEGFDDLPWRMVRLNMTDSDSHITLNKIPLTGLYDWGTGGLAGMIAWDMTNGDLVECEADFTTCVTLPDPAGTAGHGGSFGLDVNSEKVALYIQHSDMSSTWYELYVYDAAQNTLSNSLYQLSDAFVTWDYEEPVSDGDSLYFSDGPNLLKLSFGTDVVAPSVTALVIEAAVIDEDIAVTSDRVVYVTNNGAHLKSVLKTGGSPDLLMDVSAQSGQVWMMPISVGDRIVYIKILGTSFTSGVIVADGSALPYEVQDTIIASASFSSTVKVPMRPTVDNIIRTGVDGTVYSFDAATYGPGSNGIYLGTVSSNILAIMGAGFGNQLLVEGAYSSDTDVTDMYYLNADSASSLKRITSTPSVDEIPTGNM